MRSLAASVVLGVLVCFVASAVSQFDGTWRGTFNGQPTTLMPDGSYPETVSAFELRMQDRDGIIVGQFRLAHEKGKLQPLKNGKRFGSRACFDVELDSDDMRWCVQVKGDQLTGAWSKGPQGGPLLNGAGAGARLFKIAGSRVP